MEKRMASLLTIKFFACYNAELRGFIAKKLDNKGFSAISI